MNPNPIPPFPAPGAQEAAQALLAFHYETTPDMIEAAQLLTGLQGGAPKTRGRPNTRSRGRPTAEAKAITTGRKLDHLRRRRQTPSSRAPISAPAPATIFDDLPDLYPDLEEDPASPPPASPAPPGSPPPASPADAMFQRGWNRFVKANLRKMKEPLRATIQDKDELHREAMKRVGAAWRAMPIDERLDYGMAPAQRQAKQARTGVAPKINPITGQQMTRAQLRQYRKSRKTAEKKDRDLIYKKLKNFNKTAVRRSVARLKKMFRGPPGHWKAKYPLKNLASTFNKINSACDLMAAQNSPSFLLPPNLQHQYVEGDPNYDEDEEIQL